MAAPMNATNERVQKILGLALRPTTPDNEALSAIRRVHDILKSNNLDETALSIGAAAESSPALAIENARLRALVEDKEAALKDTRRRCVQVENDLYASEQALVSLQTRHARILRRGLSMRRTSASLLAAPGAVRPVKIEVSSLIGKAGGKRRPGFVPFATLRETCERLNPGPARWETAFYRMADVSRKKLYGWKIRDSVPKSVVDGLDLLDWSAAGNLRSVDRTHQNVGTAFDVLMDTPGPRKHIARFIDYGDLKSGGRIDWRDVFCARFGVEREALRAFSTGVPQAAFDALDAIDWRAEPVVRVDYQILKAAMQRAFPNAFIKSFIKIAGGRFSETSIRLWQKQGTAPVEALKMVEAHTAKAAKGTKR